MSPIYRGHTVNAAINGTRVRPSTGRSNNFPIVCVCLCDDTCMKILKKVTYQSIFNSYWQHLDIYSTSLIQDKPMLGREYLLLSLMTLFLRNFGAQAQKAMSSLSGVYSVAYVTVPSNEVAKKLARGIVENKLAACVNIIPGLTSVYEWENKINEDDELLLMIKTRTEAVGNLTTYVKANHPYTVCEVISLPIDNGNEQYLNWIGGVVPKGGSTTP